MSLRAYLLAIPKLSKSQLVHVRKFFETKKAVEDDGLQDPALFRTCLSLSNLERLCQGTLSVSLAGILPQGAWVCQQQSFWGEEDRPVVTLHTEGEPIGLLLVIVVANGLDHGDALPD